MSFNHIQISTSDRLSDLSSSCQMVVGTLLHNICAVGSKWYEFKLEYFSLLSVRQKQLIVIT